MTARRLRAFAFCGVYMPTYNVMLKEGQTFKIYGRTWRKHAPMPVTDADPYWPRIKGDSRFAWADVADPNAHEKLTGRIDRTEEQRQMPPRRRRERELKDAPRIVLEDRVRPLEPEVLDPVASVEDDPIDDGEGFEDDEGEFEGDEEVAPPAPDVAGFSSEVIELANRNVDDLKLTRPVLDALANAIGAVGPGGEPPSQAATKAIVVKWIRDRQTAIHAQLPKVVDPS